MTLLKVKKEEGHYTIKRVDRLPKKGNANWLYIIISDIVEEVYRWNTFKSKFEEIKIGKQNISNIQSGTNIIITGAGTDIDPLTISTTIESTGDIINNGEGTDRFVEEQELSDVAISGDYLDLSNKPIFKVVENEYDDMTTLYTSQGSQTNTFIQYVIDASSHPEVTSGEAYFEYLGTTVGDDTDYRLLSGAEISFITINNDINTFPAPNLRELVPDTYLPSTTGNFILRGSYFTPDMTIVIEGHTYNYWTFINSNEVRVNLTTSATEGTYDVTLDNGTSAIFADVLQVVNGTVYKPTPLDWQSTTGNIDTSEVDVVKTLVYDSAGQSTWTQVLDNTKNYKLTFNIKESPLGLLSVGTGVNVNFLNLKSVDEVTNHFQLFLRQDAGSNYRVKSQSVADANAYVELSSAKDILTKTYEFRKISSTMYIYVDGVLKITFTDVVAQDMLLQVLVDSYDIHDIKYIDLSDTGGGYTDYSKLISQFTNDSNYLKSDLSSLGAYADDTAAASGGVEIGFAYINSSTGALHRRLT